MVFVMDIHGLHKRTITIHKSGLDPGGCSSQSHPSRYLNHYPHNLNPSSNITEAIKGKANDPLSLRMVVSYLGNYCYLL